MPQLSDLLHIIRSATQCGTDGEKDESSKHDWPSSENVGKASRPAHAVSNVRISMLKSPPWNKGRGSNAVCVTNPSEIARVQGMGNGRKCGTYGFEKDGD